MHIATKQQKKKTYFTFESRFQFSKSRAPTGKNILIKLTDGRCEHERAHHSIWGLWDRYDACWQRVAPKQLSTASRSIERFKEFCRMPTIMCLSPFHRIGRSFVSSSARIHHRITLNSPRERERQRRVLCMAHSNETVLAKEWMVCICSVSVRRIHIVSVVYPWPIHCNLCRSYAMFVLAGFTLCALAGFTFPNSNTRSSSKTLQLCSFFFIGF